MPRPGDPYAKAFVVEPMKCWRMVHDRQGQATHCIEAPSWTGRWFAPSGERWWRVWACREHLDGLTGLKQFACRRDKFTSAPPLSASASIVSSWWCRS